MGRDPKGEQEKLLRRICGSSMAAPFVFGTDEYRKGQSLREPADVVWACNGCAILMYAKGSKRNAAKWMKKNAGQARGWFDEWKAGRPITGGNEWNEFSLAFNDRLHVIVVSITTGPDAVTAIDYGLADELGVLCFAHIQEETLDHLLLLGGTALDLINFLRALWVYGGNREWTREEVAVVIDGHEESSRQESGLVRDWPGVFTRERFREIVDPLVATRGEYDVSGISNKSPDRVVDAANARNIMNDVQLVDFYRMVLAVRIKVDEVRVYSSPLSPFPRAVCDMAKLAHYEFRFCVIPTFESPTMREAANIIKRFSEDYQAGKLRAGPWAVFDASKKRAMIFFPEELPKSHTELELEQWKKLRDQG